jgi:hypothetical protein
MVYFIRPATEFQTVQPFHLKYIYHIIQVRGHRPHASPVHMTPLPIPTGQQQVLHQNHWRPHVEIPGAVPLPGFGRSSTSCWRYPPARAFHFGCIYCTSTFLGDRSSFSPHRDVHPMNCSEGSPYVCKPLSSCVPSRVYHPSGPIYGETDWLDTGNGTRSVRDAWRAGGH